ncbi:hypothetical protein, partial [Pseudomonas sp. EGD-AK9]
MSDRVLDEIKKYIESGNVNFIIGAGASIGAIKTLGDFENDITKLIKDFQRENSIDSKQAIANKLNLFLKCSIDPNKSLIDGNV